MRYLKEPKRASSRRQKEIRETVTSIIERIRRNGITAIRTISSELDNYDGPLRVSPDRIESAVLSLDGKLREALETAIGNVRSFHHRQREILTDREWEIQQGVQAGIRFIPVASAAIYIPGGRFPLPSSAIMGAVPAQEAGVERIVAVSPPQGPPGMDDTILATLGLLGISEIWTIGGAQAVAAMALGAGDINAVDMLVGPGNVYVTEAKRMLFGTIGIDGLAGPSEVLIIADGTSDPRLLAADLLAQTEHDPMAQSTLICTSERTARDTMKSFDNLAGTLSTSSVISKSWRTNGTIAIASLDEAINTANRTAPEHLHLSLAEPRKALARCTSYGAAFLGTATTVPFGDYVAGTNHTLPTAGHARFSGGLWTGTFMRPLTHLEMSPQAAADLAPPGIRIAETEGLAAHALTMKLRRDLYS